MVGGENTLTCLKAASHDEIHHASPSTVSQECSCSQCIGTAVLLTFDANVSDCQHWRPGPDYYQRSMDVQTFHPDANQYSMGHNAQSIAGNNDEDLSNGQPRRRIQVAVSLIILLAISLGGYVLPTRKALERRPDSLN